MKSFSTKVKERREILNLSQPQLANLVGVSSRSIASYETTDTKPRGKIMRSLAGALQVSVDYLLKDDIDNPKHGLEKEPYLDEVREKFGDKAAREINELLEKNTALFAGGILDQDAKDSFLEAVMEAYITCKKEARKTFGRKNQ